MSLLIDVILGITIGDLCFCLSAFVGLCDYAFEGLFLKTFAVAA